MNPGDIVRIKHTAHLGQVSEEFEGKIGVIVSHAKRLYVPAAKVLVLGEIAEFDLDELEVVENGDR